MNQAQLFTLSARVTISNILPGLAPDWARDAGENRPAIQFSNNLFSGFFYQNISSFDLNIEFFHKYVPGQDDPKTAWMAGLPVEFNNTVNGNITDANKYGSVISFSSLNRSTGGLDQVEFAAELNQKGTSDGSGRLPVMYKMTRFLLILSLFVIMVKEACPVGMTTKILQLEPAMHREVRRILENLRMELFTHMAIQTREV
ncbi:MAG: hypothetical protein LBP35_02285 [Candidatus Ancillula trichonymphae]|jgi:hypothetical protein|nr:hypothetical protein [Candidatus Ancillula trichonymphae]